MTTLNEQLDKLDPPQALAPDSREQMRWRALAVILRKILLDQGKDLERAFEE